MRTPFFALLMFAMVAFSSPSLIFAVPLASPDKASSARRSNHRTAMVNNTPGVTARDAGSTSDFDNKIFDPTHYFITAGPELVPASDHIRSSDYNLTRLAARKIEPRKIEPRIRLWKNALYQYKSRGDDPHGTASSGSVGSSSHGISHRVKRANDLDTVGGNAFTGKSGDVSGGTVENINSDSTMPTLLNWNSNNAGLGGDSVSGCSAGGGGGAGGDDHQGAGGNGYSGDSGQATGGSVSGVGGMMNFNSNNAGSAGFSKSGCALGGGSVAPEAEATQPLTEVAQPETEVAQPAQNNVPWDYA